MAGQTPLLIESDGTNHSVPDHFETVSFYLKEANLTVSDDVALHICERETVVDSILVRAASTDNTFVARFRKCSDGQSYVAGQAFASIEGGLTNHVVKRATIDEAHNVIEAGSVITMDPTVSGDVSDNMVITMRIRTRVTG